MPTRPVAGKCCHLPAAVERPARRTSVCVATHRRPLSVAAPRPRLHTFRPQVFATSRRFSPRARLRACFIPLPRPELSCSGCSPLPRPPFLVGRSLPPCRSSLCAHHRSSVHAPGARLRGLDPRESALSWASIIHRHPRSLPSSGFSSPGPPFSRRATALLGCSAHDVPCAAFAFALAAPSHLQRLLHEKISFPSPSSRPAQGFEPAVRDF